MTSKRNLEIRKELHRLDDLCGQAWLDYRAKKITSQQAAAIWDEANPKKWKLINELAGITGQGTDPLR